jgi:hypothetical protein
MIERGGGLSFLLEAVKAIWILHNEGWQDLDGDVALELRIADAIDLTHAAGAERAENLVTINLCAGWQGRE